MKKAILILFFAFFTKMLCAQKIKDGTYFFTIKDLEYHGMVVGKCKAIVKGDSIRLVFLSGNLTLIKPGDVYEEGLLMKHKKTKQWIIARSKEDVNAPEVGPCSENGPRTIDFKRRVIEQC